MKYCNNCGKKITENANYCENCGSKIKKEVDIFKVVLLVGVFVVLFSSFAFGIVSWESMSNLFRLLFFAFETFLFFILSLALKSVSKNTSRVFFIIGLIMVPYTLSLLPYYSLLPSYFNLGAGLYIYLALIYLISFITYLLINIKFKSNIVNYLSLILLLMSFISASYIFNKNISLTMLFIVCYVIVINVLSLLNIFNDKFKKVLSVFSLVLGLVIVPILIYTFTRVGEINTFVNILTFILYMVDSFFKLSLNKNSVLRGFNPFTLSILSYTLIASNLNNYLNILLYALTIVFILLYYLSLLFDSKLYSITSLIMSYLIFLIVLCVGFMYGSYFALFICTIIMLIFNISLILILKSNFVHIIIPINIIFTVISLCNAFFDITGLSIVTLLIILYLVCYLLFKLVNNKYNLVYLISTLVISFISLVFINDISLISIITLVLMLITFILSFVFKENNAIRIIAYIILNFALIGAFNTNLYYALLMIGGFTIVSALILQKFTKFNLKPYILYAEIIIFLITLFNDFSYPLVFLAINAAIYVLSFLSLLKYFNKAFYRIIYFMLGLILLNKFMFLIFNVLFISNLVSILLIVIILIVLYLLDREKSVYLIIESLVLLIPYNSIVTNEFYNIYELYLVPFIVYIIAFTTTIKMDKESKNILTIVLLSIIGVFFILINQGVVSIIFDVLYAVLFIILGLIRKHNLLIYFGIGFLVITTIFNLFTVLNSLAIVITLLILGFILIGLSVYFIVKNNKDKQ